MKIQLAVDRVSIEHAVDIIKEAEPFIDIIEIGTSLFKDFGLQSLKEIRKQFQHPILADIKTMDEAEYEFRQIFKNGGDIATVMGASAIETIRICQRVSQEYNKDYMIDTLEINDEKMNQLKEFEDAIICLHLPKDKAGDLQSFIRDFMETYHLTNKIAVAGGVKLEDIPLFKELGIEIVIIGSSITKSEDINESAEKFKELVR
ncbi:orotidine 5'-phosphate decarboxylase [Desemzia sp. RIT804]|uniref:orotidine 5'-phosphate decarboxylase / HUMPS family protein n=1 Tax=Desemzia sp. RIT 804 TaxID=2810209 RepID=UPI001951771F|nr:orotidine 5'-phosphate decarboxylase [Desemzia sp. RIT 804]